jgi:hypothetical protein
LGTITVEERQSMTMANCPRRQNDLLVPFLQTGEFESLVVERCLTSTAPDAAWMEYERDADAASLARKRALFFRATFVPSLLPGLAPRVLPGSHDSRAGPARRVTLAIPST